VSVPINLHKEICAAILCINLLIVSKGVSINFESIGFFIKPVKPFSEMFGFSYASILTFQRDF